MNFKTSLKTYGLADLLSRSIGLITSPIITRLLSMQQYGAGALLSGVWSPFALAQYGGMDWAYPFYLARKKDKKEAQQLIATASFVAYVSVLLVWAGFFIAASSGGWLKSYAGVSQPELAFFILGLLPAALIYWLCYLLRYLNLADSYVRITLFGRIAPIVVVLPLLPYVAPEDRLLWSWGLGWIVSFVALIYALYEIHRAGHWPFRRSLFSARIAREMLKYGVYLIPAGGIYAMISITDRLLVGYLIGTDGVALLVIGVAVGSIGTLFSGWFGLAFDPHLSEWIANDDQAAYLPKLQLLANTLACGFSLLAALSVLWSQSLIALLFTDSYLPSAPFVPLCIFAATLAVLSRIGVATALIAQSPKYHSVLYGASLVLNITVGLLLIPMIGVIGAILGTVAAESLILVGWIYIGRVHCRNLPVRWLPAVCILISTALFIYLWTPKPALEISELMTLIVQSLILCATYMGALWLIIGRKEIIRLISYIRE